MIKPEFTENETTALMWLIDQGVRATGLQSKPAVDLVLPKLEAAKAKSLEPPSSEASTTEAD